MKRILVAFALMLAVILAFTACDMLPGNEPKEDVITIEDGYLVVNGVKTEHKVDDGKDDSEENTDVIEVADGYLVVNGVKTEHKVYTEPVLSVIDGYVAVNGIKTEYKVYAEPELSVIDGYVAVNGVKTEYKVDDGKDDSEEKTDVIEVVDGYLVVNGVKTNHKVYAEPELSVIDGYIAVNGVKTEYKVYTEPVISVIDGYVAVNGVKTEYEVSRGCEHIWKTVTTDSTCTQEGYDTMTCSLCDKVVITNKTEKLEHNYATTYTIDDNYHWFKCTGCDAIDGKEVHTPDAEDNCSVCGIPLAETLGVIYDASADGTYAEVIGYEGTAKKVKIASEYKGLPVKNIYDEAFRSKGITDVLIPNSVTSIGSSAFRGCSSLTSITIPDSVTSIGDGVFSSCSSLTSAVIGDSITSIANSAFSSCHNLRSVTIGNSVTSIGSYAFYHCDSLTSVTIPNNLTSIDSSAFSYCIINDVYIYDIGFWCDFTNAEYISHSFENIQLIENGVAKLITNLVIPDDVTCIRDSAFRGCSSLTNITIGNGVTSIGDWAFAWCDSLTTVTIPDSVTSIGNDAFWYCSNLTSVTIPDSVTSIGDSAFSNCNSALYTEYEYGKYVCTNDNPYSILIELANKNLSTYKIHEDTKFIGADVFDGCQRLTNITIPDSVTSIGEDAFYNCSSLTSINYDGTIEEWNAISKGSWWNSSTGNYTIYCTDGEIAKDGTVTYY